jgi:hypothetical protein
MRKPVHPRTKATRTMSLFIIIGVIKAKTDGPIKNPMIK